MRKYIFFAVVIAVIAVACKQDRNLVKATVVDTGDIALNGCGYLLKIEGEDRLMRPSNLPTAYMHDGYKVKVKYDSDGGGEVCAIYPKYDFIEIIQLTVIKPDLN
ncbi:MAG: hypothetical protein KDC07_03360 [Chitinophagaceae bacterium]|nr:hypothetical protein [Chitinophagaceae bacterium]MCB9044974.1 hypothetical protein [Chitinophagales bacterium]